jgi:hypothetical protein
MREQIEALRNAFAVLTEATNALIGKVDAMQAETDLSNEVAALTEVVLALATIVSEKAR